MDAAVNLTLAASRGPATSASVSAVLHSATLDPQAQNATSDPDIGPQAAKAAAGHKTGGLGRLWSTSHGSAQPAARGFGRREWRLCFSDVQLKLSGRRRAYVEGLRLAVPDNAEQHLTGEAEVTPRGDRSCNSTVQSLAKYLRQLIGARC